VDKKIPLPVLDHITFFGITYNHTIQSSNCMENQGNFMLVRINEPQKNIQNTFKLFKMIKFFLLLACIVLTLHIQ